MFTSRGSRFRAVACAVAFGSILLVGCSGSSSTDDGSSGDSSSEESAVGCPFSGTTGTTDGGSSSVGGQTVTGIVTSKQGCVDNIQMTLGAGVGPWTIAYASGPVLDAKGATVETNSSANLVVTFTGGSWKGAGAVPTTVLPIQLDHVKSVNVVPGPDSTLLVVYGLDSKRPYQASDSEKPAYVSLGIG